MLPDSQIPTPLWVFGYGSLLWNPGFPVAEQRIARANGFHRSFCMRSIHHRGTETEPGLVLALDAEPGATCDGVAFRVASEDAGETVQTLRARELISSAYVEAAIPLETETGQVTALAYVINRENWQYCQLDLEEQAQIIARSAGGRGPNDAYLYNTASHLAELGLADADMEWLVGRVKALRAEP